MAIAIPRRRPWYSPPRLLHFLAEARRFPLLSVSGLMVVLILPAIFAPLIATQDPLKGKLSDRLRPPAWVDAKFLDKTVVEKIAPGEYNRQITLQEAEKLLGRKKATLVSGGELALGSQIQEQTGKAGSTKHLLGTDKVGRDVYSRIIYGSRVSIIVAAIAIFIGGTLGTLIGIAAGYFGSWPDAIAMRLVDISLSLPLILLALVIVAVLGPSFKTVIIVLIVLLWAYYARMTRAETLAIRSQDYIARARVAGASHMRIILHHIFPNVFNSLVVLATLQVGWVIIVEASLSFLGAGIPRPTPAWGLMVADGRELVVAAWWVAFFPGLAILLVVMCMNLLGDWLRDRLDPKQRQV